MVSTCSMTLTRSHGRRSLNPSLATRASTSAFEGIAEILMIRADGGVLRQTASMGLPPDLHR
jgi:hypothetical protein